MKKLAVISFVLFPFFIHAQVWKESFDGLTNGATSDAGSTAWSTMLPSGGASSFSKQNPASGYELLVINDSGTEGTWTSGVVDISSYTEIAIEITLYSYFTYSSDYIRCYYKLDGGPEIQFGELLGSNGLSIASAASAIVSGSTLQIVVKGSDNTSGTTSGVIHGMAFDDVTMTSITVLYSRTSGNWNNTNSWSKAGFSGASCSCMPDNVSRVIIGNNRTISIPSTGTAAGVTVQSTGHLQFTGNTTLTMARGGTISIEGNGILNNNGGTGNISFGAYAYNAIIDGELAISNLTANQGSNINFTGNGMVDVVNLRINSGNGRSIILNVTGGFNISADLNFQSSSANTLLINQQPLSIGGRILFTTTDNVSLVNNSEITTNSIVVNASSSDGNSITNSANATIDAGAINLNSGDFTLDNYGTINQTGSFSNVSNGSSFINRDGSTWNYSGATTTSRLFCNNGSNTFSFNASGAQNVFPAVDNYSNLTLSGSGTKTMTGNLDINGSLSIEETAQLDVAPSLYSINIAGNWSVTSTNTNAFNERTGTVTFDGAADQTVSNTDGNEFFYNLILNKANSRVILSSTDATVSNTLSLTNGALSINGNTLNITRSNINAISRTNGCIISETATEPYSELKWSVGNSTGAFVFPFGKSLAGNDYIPFTFNVTTAGAPATGTVSLLTYPTSSANLPWPVGVTNLNSTPGTDNSAKVVDRFWYITLNGYTTNPYSNITFTATPAEVASLTNIKAQRWNSVTGKWDSPKSGQINPDNYSVTVPGVNTFSPWTLSQVDAPLPIKLTSFSAAVKNDIVYLDWQTSQEIDNEFFTLLKSGDAESFEELSKIKGAGTSSKTSYYQAMDLRPIEGKSYYRLKQTDFDGRESYAGMVMVEYHQQHSRLNAYPVPFNGQELTVELSGLRANEKITLEILSITGQQLFTKRIAADSSGEFKDKITFNHTLAPGIYYLKAGGYLNLVVE